MKKEKINQRSQPDLYARSGKIKDLEEITRDWRPVKYVGERKPETRQRKPVYQNAIE